MQKSAFEQLCRNILCDCFYDMAVASCVARENRALAQQTPRLFALRVDPSGSENAPSFLIGLTTPSIASREAFESEVD